MVFCCNWDKYGVAVAGREAVKHVRARGRAKVRARVRVRVRYEPDSAVRPI